MAHPGEVETIHGLFLEHWRLCREQVANLNCTKAMAIGNEPNPGVVENLHGKCRVTLPEDDLCFSWLTITSKRIKKAHTEALHVLFFF